MNKTVRELHRSFQETRFMMTTAVAAAVSGVAFLVFSREFGLPQLKAGILTTIIFAGIMAIGRFCTARIYKKMGKEEKKANDRPL